MHVEEAAGIDHIFGQDSHAALIVKAVLFHMSINVVKDYPQAAPLGEGEIRRYVGAKLLPLLKIMMLVDNDGWVMFQPGTRPQQRDETLAAFESVAQIVDDAAPAGEMAAAG
jgi:hypothetical protein